MSTGTALSLEIKNQQVLVYCAVCGNCSSWNYMADKFPKTKTHILSTQIFLGSISVARHEFFFFFFFQAAQTYAISKNRKASVHKTASTLSPSPHSSNSQVKENFEYMRTSASEL